MTEAAFTALGVALLLLGFIGCVVPLIPGVLCAYAALLALLPTAAAPSAGQLAAGAALAAVAVVLDYVVPSLGARRFACTRWGVLGCLVGTVAGVFFLPWGLILGPFGGAVLGELIAGRDLPAALRGGVGALLGFLATVVLKFAVCAFFAVWFVRARWG